MTELKVLQFICVSIWCIDLLLYLGLFLISEEIRKLREEKK